MLSAIDLKNIYAVLTSPALKVDGSQIMPLAQLASKVAKAAKAAEEAPSVDSPRPTE